MVVDTKKEPDALVMERGRVFKMWLEYEAENNTDLALICGAFEDVAQEFLETSEVNVEFQPLLYGAIKGHAMAWGYLQDFNADMRLYLAHYLAVWLED